MKRLKEQKGITLIALIITIIVLLILAVVAIGAVQNDGIINHAKNAREEYGKAGVNENTTIQNYLDKIKDNLPTGTGSGTSAGNGEGNNSGKDEEKVDIINFKIGIATREAEAGMSFEQWVNSSYASIGDGWSKRARHGVEYEVIYDNEVGKYAMYEGRFINASELIVEGREYQYGNIYFSGNGNKTTFTINGITYEAEEEMEWGAWIESDYNTFKNLQIMEKQICGAGSEEDIIMKYDGNSVKAEDYIIPNENYDYIVN